MTISNDVPFGTGVLLLVGHDDTFSLLPPAG
jgi:hypothetical protein